MECDCGDIVPEDHTYRWTYANNWGHGGKCTVCGYEGAVPNKHTGGTATCTEKAQCADCGYPYGEPLGHKWSNAWTTDEKNHWKECARCAERTDEAAHRGGRATYTTKARCAICGQAYGKLLSDYKVIEMGR